jgi:hypothetical protein
MSADIGSLHGILKDPTRRRILSVLNERGALAYVEILGLLEIEHTGKLNYHLKQLGDLIQKDENGRYSLTEKGRLASQVMVRFQPLPGPNSLATLHIGRTGLGKLLLVLSIPSFALSFIPLSQDYPTAWDFAMLLGVITMMLLIFGTIFTLPAGQLASGPVHFRELLGYAGLESGLTFLSIVVLLLRPLDLPGPYIVYLVAIPGFATWLVMALRSKVHLAGEVVKVLLVATAFLWVGGLLLFGTLTAGMEAQSGSISIFRDVIFSIAVMTLFLYPGILATEGAYRLVGWRAPLRE